MKNVAAVRSRDKKITNDILGIGVEARKACENNPSAVNGTVGMLYGDDKTFTYFESVMAIYNKLKPNAFLPYTSTPGGPDFEEAVGKWTFRQYYDFYKENFHYKVNATPGGSGAISSAFANYLDQGDDVILPSVAWDPYYIMAREQELNTVEYNLFNENGDFDLTSFANVVETTAKKQGRVLVLINDPCQNPTGYTLSNEEWDKVIEILNKQVDNGIPTVLLYDMAYVDFHKSGLDESRKTYESFKNASDDLLILSCFSGSKTLAFYGVRIGAIIGISKNKDIIDEFAEIISFSSRGRWSSSSNIGIQTIIELVNDKEQLQKFEKELEESVQLLAKRGEIFVKESIECGLDILPYKSGFFLTLPNCTKEFHQRLKDNSIYTIPLEGNLIRFALSAIPTESIYGLAKRVKDIKDNE